MRTQNNRSTVEPRLVHGGQLRTAPTSEPPQPMCMLPSPTPAPVLPRSVVGMLSDEQLEDRADLRHAPLL